MKNILFVELLGGLGDLLMALPAIHALALSHPQAELAVLTFAPGAELLGADPLVGRVHLAERGDSSEPDRPRRALEALLARQRFDLIVSDTAYAGIDELVATSAPRAVANLWRQPPAGQTIEGRFLQILGQEQLIEPWTLGLKPRLALSAEDHLWAAAQLARPARRALLHPHAGMPIKLWPLDRFVILGKILRDDFGLEIVLPGGVGGEADIAQRIAEVLGHGATVLPAGTLRQFAAAAARSDLIVGADTGPVRLASAAGALTIALYGPTWSGRYGLRPPHVNLQGYPQCPQRVIHDFTLQPCWYAGTCPLGLWQNCLEDVSVGDVLEAAQDLLNKTAWWGKPLAAPEAGKGKKT